MNPSCPAHHDSIEESNFFYDCNICLGPCLNEPVVTHCGHLFCWPCLYLWIKDNTVCPVCKSSTRAEQVLPIYGRSSARKLSSGALEKDIPPRPAAKAFREKQRPVFLFDSSMEDNYSQLFFFQSFFTFSEEISEKSQELLPRLVMLVSTFLIFWLLLTPES